MGKLVGTGKTSGGKSLWMVVSGRVVGLPGWVGGWVGGGGVGGGVGVFVVGGGVVVAVAVMVLVLVVVVPGQFVH